MLDRGSSFADAEVIATLRERFVPLALDVWYEQRRDDAAGELFRKLVAQRPGMTPERSTQGFYAFTADGTLLEGWNHRGLDRLRQHVARALDEFDADAAKGAAEQARASAAADDVPSTPPPQSTQPPAAADPRFDRTLPAGAAIVAVHTRVVAADWPPPADDHQRRMQQATGFDHLWILRDELDELRAGRFPRPLARRIARFHCVDDTRGEPPHWEPGEVALSRIDLARDAAEPAAWSLDGEVSLRSADGARRFDARAGGAITFDDVGRLERFDLALRGLFEGEGQYTRGAPPGPFTLAIVLTLAGPGEHRKVPPQGARWLDDYLGRVRGRE